MTEEEDKIIGGYIARKVVAWMVGIGVVFLFASGMAAADVTSRIANLEGSRLTREEAAGLRSSIDLLRQEMGYLRSDIAALKAEVAKSAR